MQAKFNPSNKKKICLCCGQQPKQQLPICCRIQDIYNINQSLGFYFTYIKAMCSMLFLIALVIGIYGLVYVIQNCHQKNNFINVYGIPISQFHVFFTKLLLILQICILILMYFFIAYLYYINAHIHKKIFINYKKASDYSVLISGVDHQKITGQIILNSFQIFKIVDILYTHKIQDYIKKLSQKSILVAKKNLYYKRLEDQKVEEIQTKIDKIDEKVFNVKNRLNLGLQKTLRTDKIIIKFISPEEKMKFQQMYKSSIYQTIFHTFCGGSQIQINENKMYVQPLGEPHQIIWQNFEIKSKQRYLRVLTGNILTFFILACSYMIVALLTKAQKDYNGTKDVILSIIFSVVIQSTNFILDLFIELLTQWQRRYTLTGQIRAILIKNFISFFLNTTILPFSLFIFAWGIPNQDDLIRNIFTLFIVSNFISPFVSLYVRPKSLYYFYKKRKIENQGNRMCQIIGKQCVQTQIKANQYFQRVDFDLCARYSITIQIITNSIFYAAVFPIGVIITFFGLILAYWTSKWWLIKHCSIPKFSYRLGRLIDISTFFPCILAFGYFFNLIMMTSQSQIDRLWPLLIALITLPISLLFFVFGNKIAENVVVNQFKALDEIQRTIQIDEQQRIYMKQVPDYRQLNPTTFIHEDIHNQIKKNQFQNIFDHLQSYVTQKQVSRLRRDSYLESGVYRKSLSQSQKNKKINNQ